MCCPYGLLVQNVELLSASVLLQQLACDLAFRCKNDAVVREDSECSAGVRDGF